MTRFIADDFLTLHVLEVVVDSMESAGCAILAELGGTTGQVVVVVAVECYFVACE